MQNSDEIADFVIEQLEKTFGDSVDDFGVFNIIEDPNHMHLNISFQAYNYFIILFTYDMGRFGCSIQFGQHTVGLPNSQKWFDEADFSIFFKELKEELELRIPDKFLKARGWM